MKNKELHIVSFDVPFPANYGGVIDVFYRIKSLHRLGVKIHLHCFEYGRGESQELEKYCFKIYYYKRSKTIFSFFSVLPFIVKTRINHQLLNRLKSDDLPILFEGLHTTWYLTDQEIKRRCTFVRTHNIEHEYYQLIGSKSNLFKKLFFYSEAIKLKIFESILSNAKFLLSIKESDVSYFKKFNSNTFLVSPSYKELGMNHFAPTTKKYVLFQGNLSVKENENAVRWLIQNVWNKGVEFNWIVAGKNPTKELESILSSLSIQLVKNPSDQEMNELIQNAHVHLLYTDQSTGVKLKLIAVLQTKGWIIVNTKLVEGTELGKYCKIANSSSEYIEILKVLIEQELPNEEIQKRIHLFDNELNIDKNNSLIVNLMN